MNSLTPLLALFLITTVLLFSACEKDPSEECAQEIITDPNYFSVDRILSNGCAKQQGIDYILTGNTTYVVSANLFIEAGTIIELEDSAALVIEGAGTLQASGTATAPIIIRGHYKSTGNWRGLFVRSNSYLNQLHQVHLQDAGGATIAGETARGAVVLLDQGKMAISSSRIEESASYGINIASPMAGLSELKNSVITNNNLPLRLGTKQANTLSDNNSMKGNIRDYVEFGIQGFTNEEYTWPRLDVPYRLFSMDSASNPIQTLSGTASLIIEAGNTLEMTPESGFEVRDLGRIEAVGTDEALIVFTGTTKDYGTWRGFEFRFTMADNRFEHVRVEHAGSEEGVIYMWGNPRLSFRDVEFTYSRNCAFYDAPKTSNQSINSNLFFIDMMYNYVNSVYCKGS